MMKINSFQIALFTSSLINPPNKLEFVMEFIKTTGGFLDADPVLLPVPADIPQDVPRMILKSKDGKWSCNIALNRVDIFLKPKEEEWREIEQIIKERQVKIIDFLNKEQIKLFRMGVVGNIFIRSSKSGREYIINNFIRKEIVNDVYEIKLHFLKKNETEQFETNEWVRIDSWRNSQDLMDDKGILVIIDINTPLEMSYDFDVEKSVQFTGYCIGRIKSIVEKYFSKYEL